jgi:hypothetical protein
LLRPGAAYRGYPALRVELHETFGPRP